MTKFSHKWSTKNGLFLEFKDNLAFATHLPQYVLKRLNEGFFCSYPLTEENYPRF